MTDLAAVRDTDLDLTRHARAGFILLGLLVLLVFGWGGLAQISGAVVASGRVAVESSVKRVQHREGGIVSEVLVHEGDLVRAGQLLARLDGVVPNANAAVIEDQLSQLIARKLRLEAERDGLADFVVPTNAPTTPEFARMVAAERKLMAARRVGRQQRKAQIREQIAQAGDEVDGLQAQITSGEAQARLIQGELAGIRRLHQQGYAPLSRVNQLEREAESLSGQKGQLTAAVARARTHASEIKLQGLQVDSQGLADVMSELKDTETKLAQLTEQGVAADDQVRRVEVRAPAAGRVQQLALHTKGGVVAPGETLMLIVPQDDALVVEVMVDPRYIDQVGPGRPAHVRFTSFSTRDTPEIMGRVDRVSADAQTEEKTGASFYLARLKLDAKSLPSALRGRLVPGMPAEVQIETSRHSALSYFIKPLSDQLARTFKED